MPEWLVFLRMACAFAEGAAELVDYRQRQKTAGATACVAAVVGDPQCRIAILGGREGMPRSLASVYGGPITRFLSGFRGGFARTIATPGAGSLCGGVAASCDGSALLVSDCMAHCLYIISVRTGVCLRTIGGFGAGPLQWSYPYQVCTTSDGFVFVVEYGTASWYH